MLCVRAATCRQLIPDRLAPLPPLPSIPGPPVIEDKASRNHNQPSGELCPSFCHEGAKPSEVVLPELLEDVRIAVHCCVVVPGRTKSRVKNEPMVGLQEVVPGSALGRPVAGGKKSRQLGRQ